MTLLRFKKCPRLGEPLGDLRVVFSCWDFNCLRFSDRVFRHFQPWHSECHHQSQRPSKQKKQEHRKPSPMCTQQISQIFKVSVLDTFLAVFPEFSGPLSAAGLDQHHESGPLFSPSTAASRNPRPGKTARTELAQQQTGDLFDSALLLSI